MIDWLPCAVGHSRDGRVHRGGRDLRREICRQPGDTTATHTYTRLKHSCGSSPRLCSGRGSITAPAGPSARPPIPPPHHQQRPSLLRAPRFIGINSHHIISSSVSTPDEPTPPHQPAVPTPRGPSARPPRRRYDAMPMPMPPRHQLQQRHGVGYRRSIDGTAPFRHSNRLIAPVAASSFPVSPHHSRQLFTSSTVTNIINGPRAFDRGSKTR